MAIIYETHRSLKNFDIYLASPWRNPNFHPHLHESFELLFVQEGEISVRLEETEYTVRQGQLILILPNLIHEYRSKAENNVGHLLIFSADYLPEIYETAAKNGFRHPILEQCEASFLRLLQSRDNHYIFRSELYGIAAVYMKNAAIPPAVRRNKELAIKIFEYIENHYEENIDEQGLARTLGYHPRYLSRMINQNFGVSFTVLLNEFRIHMAKNLLLSSKESVTEIYTRVGFDSQSSFNRNFKRITGIAPREYRNGIKQHLF